MSQLAEDGGETKSSQEALRKLHIQPHFLRSLASIEENIHTCYLFAG